MQRGKGYDTGKRGEGRGARMDGMGVDGEWWDGGGWEVDLRRKKLVGFEGRDRGR